MSGRYALDTNILIALIDREESVRERVVAADEIFIPSTVLGELYFGEFHSGRVDENVARVDDLVRSYAVLAALGFFLMLAAILGAAVSRARRKPEPRPPTA